MRIKSSAIQSHIKNSLLPIYLVSGDEPFQSLEVADLIRQAAKKQGFVEREVHHVERGFDWGLLIQSANSLSLFAEKKIIEIRMTNAKPGDAGSKAICEYCEVLPADNILMITMSKVDAAAQRAKWFKKIDERGGVVQIWPIEADRLPKWIGQRLKSKKLTANSEVIQLLAEKVEGNLLAAAQEIDKFAINAPTEVTMEDVLESVADDAKYDIFKLVDAAVSGKSKRTAQIVRGLKASGEEPVVILWALTREIRSMINMAAEKKRGVPIPQIFQKNRVWDKRAAIVKSGLTRMPESQWAALLPMAMHADQVAKGVTAGNIWDELLDLSFAIAGRQLNRVSCI